MMSIWKNANNWLAFKHCQDMATFSSSIAERSHLHGRNIGVPQGIESHGPAPPEMVDGGYI
jgi:hypothetical protein